MSRNSAGGEWACREHPLPILDAQAWECWGCVSHFVAKLDSPSNIWEVVYETSEKYDTIFLACRECATFRVGILLRASALSMKTNIDTRTIV